MPVSSKYGLIDMTGQKIGRLLVLHREGTGKTAYWKCLCDCGNFAIVWGAALRAGTTKSCGCIHKEATARVGKLSITHGMSKTKEYALWRGMVNRCDPNNTYAQDNYAMRGIKVCQGWRKFENFHADMGMRLSPKHTVDRKNNNMGYFCGHCEECVANGWPANCRWATHLEQNNNRRDNRLLTFGGETYSLAVWARTYSMDENTLRNRLNRGWDIEKSLTFPIDKRKGTKIRDRGSSRRFE